MITLESRGINREEVPRLMKIQKGQFEVVSFSNTESVLSNLDGEHVEDIENAKLKLKEVDTGNKSSNGGL